MEEFTGSNLRARSLSLSLPLTTPPPFFFCLNTELSLGPHVLIKCFNAGLYLPEAPLLTFFSFISAPLSFLPATDVSTRSPMLLCYQLNNSTGMLFSSHIHRAVPSCSVIGLTKRDWLCEVYSAEAIFPE